jgi:hypothetical protein
MNRQSTLYDALTLVNHYVYIPFLALIVFIAFYGLNLQKAALYDFRNTGAGWHETNHVARMIWHERYSKRHVPTMIAAYGLPTLAVLAVVLDRLLSLFG